MSDLNANEPCAPGCPGCATALRTARPQGAEEEDSMTPEEQAREIVDRVFGPDPYGVWPKSQMAEEIAAALAQARREEREACIDDVMEHSCQTYSECCYCQNEIKNAIRARAQEQP